MDGKTGEAEQGDDHDHDPDPRGIGLDAGRKADENPRRHGRAREDLRRMHLAGRGRNREVHNAAASADVPLWLRPLGVVALMR